MPLKTVEADSSQVLRGSLNDRCNSVRGEIFSAFTWQEKDLHRRGARKVYILFCDNQAKGETQTSQAQLISQFSRLAKHEDNFYLADINDNAYLAELFRIQEAPTLFTGFVIAPKYIAVPVTDIFAPGHREDDDLYDPRDNPWAVGEDEVRKELNWIHRQHSIRGMI